MIKKIVITYGTFDLIHIGHIRLLQRARAMGDSLIVGLSTDGFNTVKHKNSFMDYESRKEILEAIRYVDLVIPEKNWGQKIDDIKKHDVDIFTIGDDWEGKFDFLKDHCNVIYLPRTRFVSSSGLKTQLSTTENNT